MFCIVLGHSLWLIDHNIDSTSQQKHNVVTRLQRRTRNTQRCSNADATASKLQHCFKVASTLDSKFNLLTYLLITVYYECSIGNNVATLKS